MNTDLPDLPGAICATVDPELWFSDRQPGWAETERRAKALCRSCPVVAECLAYALKEPLAGIWGGLNEAERHRLAQTPGTTDRAMRARSVAARMKREVRADRVATAGRLRDGGLEVDVIALRLGVTRRSALRYLADAS